MRILPIVERELRVSSRQARTYWTRVVFAFCGVGLGAFVYLINLNSSSTEFSAELIAFLTGIAVIYSLLAGTLFTADCLSEEKREGTLGLLFLTDLRGYDVVFGKMAATSLRGFYALVALFPLLSISLMSGGVTYLEFWRLVLAVTDIFIFSLAAGIFVSALSRAARKAMLAAVLLILGLAIAPFICAIIVQIYHRTNVKLVLSVMLPSPCSTLVFFSDGGYRVYPKLYWGSVAMCWSWIGLLLALASWIAPRSWQDRPAGRRSLQWRALWRRCFRGDTAREKAFRQRLLGVNAFYWLASRVRPKPASLWVMLTALAVLWGWECVKSASDWFNEGVYFPTAVLLNLLLKVHVAAEAGRELGEDREARTLEVVLSTPLSVNEILRGQWLALRRQFQTPFVIVIGMQLIFLAASLQRESFHVNAINPVLWLACLLMLLLDATAMVWFAMWMALTIKKPHGSGANTIVLFLVVPGILFFVILLAGSAINDFFHLSLPPPHWKSLAALWFGLGLGIDAVFGLLAWWQVKTRFRQFALKRTVPGGRRFVLWFRRRG